MRILERTGVLAVYGTWLLTSTVQAQNLPSPMRLTDLVEIVRANNPEVTERRAMARASAARPRMVGGLDDPTLSFEWWQQPVDFSMVPLMLTVRQPLPWPGRIDARQQVAEREAVSAQHSVTEAERRLEREAKRAFLDVALAERSLFINEHERTLLEAMVQVAESKYRVGKAPQVTILKTQEEVLTNDNERLDLERSRAVAHARLNALLNRESRAPLPTLALPTSAALLPSEDELMRMANDHRPEIRLANARLAEAAAKLEVARRESNPELAVWAGYMLNIHGVDTFTAGVSTTLPLFSRGRRGAAVALAEAELQAGQAALAGAKQQTAADIHTALLEIEAAQRHERLHAQKLIPLSELSLQSAQSAYQNDRIDFFSVLDAARMVRDHHLNHERYLVEYERRLADLELAVGQDFPRGDAP